MRTLDQRTYVSQATYRSHMSTSSAHAVIVDNLVRITSDRELPRNKLAKKIQTSPSTLVPAFNADADRVPSVPTLERIAHALKVPMWVLLVPGVPANPGKIHGLEEVVDGYLSDRHAPADPVAALPSDEAEIVLAYRTLGAEGKAGLRMLLSEFTDRQVPVYDPPGGLLPSDSDEVDPAPDSSLTQPG